MNCLSRFVTDCSGNINSFVRYCLTGSGFVNVFHVIQAVALSDTIQLEQLDAQKILSRRACYRVSLLPELATYKRFMQACRQRYKVITAHVARVF